MLLISLIPRYQNTGSDAEMSGWHTLVRRDCTTMVCPPAAADIEQTLDSLNMVSYGKQLDHKAPRYLTPLICTCVRAPIIIRYCLQGVYRSALGLAGLYIEEWQWDDGNLSHLSRGLNRRIVEQVWLNAPQFRRNTGRRGRDRRDSRQMIGPDDGGAMWVICIEPISRQQGLWRAFTGWPAESEDKQWYGKGR